MFSSSGVISEMIIVFFQLILSVVGVPSTDFMSTITSERVRGYIARLPHKKPVAFSTLYPAASPEAVNLLAQLLVLDPAKRIEVEGALKEPFLEK